MRGSLVGASAKSILDGVSNERLLELAEVAVQLMGWEARMKHYESLGLWFQHNREDGSPIPTVSVILTYMANRICQRFSFPNSALSTERRIACETACDNTDLFVEQNEHGVFVATTVYWVLIGDCRAALERHPRNVVLPILPPHVPNDEAAFKQFYYATLRPAVDALYEAVAAYILEHKLNKTDKKFNNDEIFVQ
jgi:hypothetical protein